MTRGQLAAGLTLAAGAAVLAGALVWIGRTTLRLEAEQREANRLAAQEEKARLALWRLDSALTVVLGRENSRPAERFTAAEPEETPSFTRRRFEADPHPPVTKAKTAPPEPVPVDLLAQAVDQAPANQAVQANVQELQNQSAEIQQTQLNTVELNQRLRNAGQQSTFLGPGAETTPPPVTIPVPARAEPTPPVKAETTPAPAQQKAPEPAPIRRPVRRSPPKPASQVVTTFQPTWIRNELYLVRRVREGKESRLQALWVNWPGLRTDLLGQIRDLLPAADLIPVQAGETTDPGRRLALLPVRLSLGTVPPEPSPPAWSPARITLAASSGAIALACLAVTALLLGSLRQSQRRADFVSAVTHELRTPLTTVRMYTEMLADGMVPPDGQAGYLATLHTEAERLGHLVENVLAYSRLERQSGKARLETLKLKDLLAGIADRLGERAARDGFTLVIHPLDEPVQVTADPAAVERILFNWVDNACKYAGEATDRRLEVRPLLQGHHAVLRLSDHGPGVPSETRRRIFRPFHKSAARAAVSAPGVGLGLALSRRLARSQGGDLRLGEETDQGEGAVFELLLRRGLRALG